MVAEVGLMVSVGQDETKSVRRFARLRRAGKNKTAKRRPPPEKNGNQSDFGGLGGCHPPPAYLGYRLS
jgi:hypothetical protein